MADPELGGWNLTITRLDELDLLVGVDHDLAIYTSGLTYYVQNNVPTIVGQINDADITVSDPETLGYDYAASIPLTDAVTNLAAGKYTQELIGNTGSGLITLVKGYLTVEELPSKYTDYVVSPASMKTPAALAPTEVTWLTDLKKYSFDQGEFLYIQGVQLPHGYVPGTDLGMHVHFAPDSAIADTETVIFTFTYTLASINTLFPATASVTCTFTNNAAARASLPAACLSGTNIVANAHLIAGGGTITGTGLTLSAIVDGKLIRSAADTFTGEPVLLSADIHYEINRLGSSSATSG